MELVSKDIIWFISNLKTFELKTWFHLSRIQGIRTWRIIIGSKSLGIWFEYIYELILTLVWNWDVCECIRMKWMEFNLANCILF